MYRYRKIGLAISISVLAAFVLIAIFSPVLAPYDPYKIVGAPLEEPSRNHPLGTNNMGQDIFSRLLCGTRATLIVGFGGALLIVLIGTCVGIISGYYGGKIDELLTRAVDVVMALPMFPLLIMLAMFLKPSILTLIFLMGILGWTGCARIIRSQVLPFSESNFISGVKAIGASDIYIMVKHVFPNILPLVLVKFVFATQDCMLMEVGLGFLGLEVGLRKSVMGCNPRRVMRASTSRSDRRVWSSWRASTLGEASFGGFGKTLTFEPL